MKIKVSIFILLLISFSCADKKQEKKENIQKVKTVNIKQNYPIVNKKNIYNQTDIIDCDQYWKNTFPKDTLKVKLINKIISKNKDLLTKNNLAFLIALISKNKSDLAFNNILFPIFRLSESEIGIFTDANSKAEINLVEKFDNIKENVEKHPAKLFFYPELLNFVFKGKTRPEIKYYSKDGKGKTKIKELGIFLDACLEYFEYSIDTTDITINDKLLFGSKFDIDLIYENIPSIDTLIQNSYEEDCYDCKTSMKKQRTFARLKGTDNLYFIFADTFPLNNEFYTPSRALILINENKILYLWYNEIDLFGCNCL